MLTAAEQAERKELKARMEALNSKEVKQTFDNKLSVKIGEKGGLVISGLARFPVNLYASQAIKLQKLFNSAEFQKFITDNAANLAKKE